MNAFHHIIQTHVELERLAWCPPVIPALRRLKCTVCTQPIGPRGWAIGWGRINGGPLRGMRLCHVCGQKAEQP